jgi:hypothetical protein
MLSYSNHAQRRMKERKVTRGEVELVYDDPEITYPDIEGNPCYVRHVEGRRIRIVVAQDDPTFVITVITPDDEV